MLQPEHRGGQRHYGTKDVVRLQIILMGKRFGLTIGEIKHLLDSRTLEGRPPTDAHDLGLGRDAIKARIEELTRQRQAVDEAIWEPGAAMLVPPRTGVSERVAIDA